jgi:hypothetical protein
MGELGWGQENTLLIWFIEMITSIILSFLWFLSLWFNSNLIKRKKAWTSLTVLASTDPNGMKIWQCFRALPSPLYSMPSGQISLDWPIGRSRVGGGESYIAASFYWVDVVQIHLFSPSILHAHLTGRHHPCHCWYSCLPATTVPHCNPQDPCSFLYPPLSQFLQFASFCFSAALQRNPRS